MEVLISVLKNEQNDSQYVLLGTGFISSYVITKMFIILLKIMEYSRLGLEMVRK